MLVGVALVCVLGMVAPGLLFASGTNTANTATTSTTASTPTTQREAETTLPPSAMQCSSIVDGAPVPGRLGGCTGPDGAGEPASFLSCPDGSLIVVVAGHVGRPGSVWKQVPEGATQEQLVSIGC
ncbi:MAG: hypothetical protein JST64_02085 [Actinobacteria bacterium]|nr:hypothetical protein [Actinomycetota bacterium]